MAHNYIRLHTNIDPLVNLWWDEIEEYYRTNNMSLSGRKDISYEDWIQSNNFGLEFHSCVDDCNVYKITNIKRFTLANIKHGLC